MRALIFAVTLLLAGPVWAQGWFKSFEANGHCTADVTPYTCCTAANAGTCESTSLQVGKSVDPKRTKVAYYNFTAATNSDVLGIWMCDSVSIDFNADEDGTTAGSTAYVRECSSDTASETICPIVSVDINGDGTITAADEQTLTGAINRRGFRGLKSAKPYIFIDMEAFGQEGTVTVVCNGS